MDPKGSEHLGGATSPEPYGAGGKPSTWLPPGRLTELPQIQHACGTPRVQQTPPKKLHALSFAQPQAQK